VVVAKVKKHSAIFLLLAGLIFRLPSGAQEFSSTFGTGLAFLWAAELPDRPDAAHSLLAEYPAPAAADFTVADSCSPIVVTRETNELFRVANYFDFSDARDCQFSWQLRKFASPLETNVAFTVVRQGLLDSPIVPPGRIGRLSIHAAAARNADALALRVNDPAGRELGTWVWPLRRGDFYRLTQEPAEHRAAPAETNGIITITAGELVAAFSKDTGRLLSVRRGAQEFSLTNGPRLATGSAALRQIHYDDDGPDAFVSAKFNGDLKSIFWRVNGNGWINCDYTYTAAASNDFSGVLFDYPETLVTRKRWLGDGPYCVWPNRLCGVTLGVWENDRTHSRAAARDWMFPEFAGFFSGVRWLELDTTEGQITILNNNAVPFVQVLTPSISMPGQAGVAAAPVPQCGLAFLDAISPIGGATAAPPPNLPQDESSPAPVEYAGSVSFYFGKIPEL
jgi:hypothetical protein